MKSNKNKLFPIIITILIIVVIIYLFATVKQPLIVCEKKVNDDVGVTVLERLETSINGNKIDKITLTKTITLDEKYLDSDTQLDSIVFSLEKSYQYLGDDNYSVGKTDDSVIVKVEVENDEIIILDNVEFFYNDGLQLKINSNTKSSDVVTLKVGDIYTEGKLMTRLKNNGYSCK